MRQRLYISQTSGLSSKNIPSTPRRTFSSSLESNSNRSSSSPKAKYNRNNEHHQFDWQDKFIQSIYLILKPIVFLFFMIFWIVKEPVIRIVTFFTMVVSSVAVDPLLYAWSSVPINQNWMPTSETRRKITHWCTALLLLLLSASAFKYYNSDHSLSEALKNMLSSVEKPAFYNQSPDLSAINKRLAIVDHKLAEQSKQANNEYTKIWSTIKDYHNQFKDQQNQLKDSQHQLKDHQNQLKDYQNQFKDHQDQFNDHLKDSNEEYTRIWTAIEAEKAQLKELQHKLGHDLRQTIEYQLPKMILVRTDEDGKFELSPQFYRYLQDASFWKNFLKQNKQAIHQYLAGEMTEFLEQQKKQGAVISKDAFMKLIANDLSHYYLHKQGNTDDSPSLNELIQAAVRTYHQDVLNTADFALESRGGRILHSKTSATYQPLSFLLQRLFKSLGLSIWEHPPELAIRANTNVGDCWTMAGSEGTLAILLSQPIHIQSVTIDHPSRELLLDGIHSAPKDLEFFGLSSYPPNDQFYTPLGSVRYDIENNSSNIQTFDLQIHPTQASRAVLVKVNTNWGNPDHTDIYRIRIHGLPAEKNST